MSGEERDKDEACQPGQPQQQRLLVTQSVGRNSTDIDTNNISDRARATDCELPIGGNLVARFGVDISAEMVLEGRERDQRAEQCSVVAIHDDSQRDDHRPDTGFPMPAEGLGDCQIMLLLSVESSIFPPAGVVSGDFDMVGGFHRNLFGLHTVEL